MIKPTPSNTISISPTQSKMARAALDWGLRDLANHARVGITTVFRFENGQATPIPATLAAIQRAFEEAGIEFTPDGGVRPRTAPIPEEAL